MTQYALLTNESLPPALQAMAPLSASSDPHASWVFHTGGAAMWEWLVPYAIHKGRNTLERAGRSDLLEALDRYVDYDATVFAPPLRDEWYRHLPLSDWADLLSEVVPYLADYLRRPEDGAYWHRANVSHHAAKATVPMLHVSSWYDIFSEGAPTAFAAIRDQAPSPEIRQAQRLVLGPWVHASYADPSSLVGDLDLGAASRPDMHALQVRWFDHWLKDVDSGLLDEPPVLAFAMGTNEWQRFERWPPAESEVRELHLASGGGAGSVVGDGRLSFSPAVGAPVDAYDYDPSDPVPTLGGNNLSVGRGVRDQRRVQGRDDVLVYTSDVLGEPLQVAGLVTVRLYVSSSTLDTDFCATLVDVHTDGYAQNLVDGILRTRCRESGERATLMEPETVYEVLVELGHVSNVFLTGHQIGLHVTSSNFPRFDRNLNTGAPFGSGTEPVVARQRVWHDRTRPSAVLLPVLPEGAALTGWLRSND